MSRADSVDLLERLVKVRQESRKSWHEAVEM